MRIQRLNLKKLDNTRDLGGMPTKDGRKIKRGKLIRSGRLYKLPAQTIDALKSIGVTTIIDMRTDRERLEYPPALIDGVTHVHLPLVCTATTGITHQKSMAKTMMSESKRIKEEFGNADNYMTSMYSIILFDDDGKKRLKTFFDYVLKEEGCLRWCCNAGKDRTGICAMLLEGLLGVDEKLIVEDFAATKRFQRHKRAAQRFGLFISPIPLRFKHILYAFMDAKPQYIRGAISQIKEKYGSIENYCKQALGLTDEDVQFLKDKYLE